MCVQSQDKTSNTTHDHLTLVQLYHLLSYKLPATRERWLHGAVQQDMFRATLTYSDLQQMVTTSHQEPVTDTLSVGGHAARSWSHGLYHVTAPYRGQLWYTVTHKW